MDYLSEAKQLLISFYTEWFTIIAFFVASVLLVIMNFTHQIYSKSKSAMFTLVLCGYSMI